MAGARSVHISQSDAGDHQTVLKTKQVIILSIINTMTKLPLLIVIFNIFWTSHSSSFLDKESLTFLLDNQLTESGNVNSKCLFPWNHLNLVINK